MSLSTIPPHLAATTVAWGELGQFATPASFRLTQNPLGAVLLPQALIPVGRFRRRKAFRRLRRPTVRWVTPLRQVAFILAETEA